MSEQAYTIAANVRRMRLQKKLSQENLADIVGLPQPRISELESARGNPTTRTLATIAEALETTVAALVTPTEKGDNHV